MRITGVIKLKKNQEKEAFCFCSPIITSFLQGKKAKTVTIEFLYFWKDFPIF